MAPAALPHHRDVRFRIRRLIGRPASQQRIEVFPDEASQIAPSGLPTQGSHFVLEPFHAAARCFEA